MAGIVAITDYAVARPPSKGSVNASCRQIRTLDAVMMGMVDTPCIPFRWAVLQHTLSWLVLGYLKRESGVAGCLQHWVDYEAVVSSS